MKTRRATNGTATQITNNDAPAIGTSIISLRTTNSERTKHRMSPEPGPCLQAVVLSHEQASPAVEAASFFTDVAAQGRVSEEMLSQMAQIEYQGDNLAHTIIEQLKRGSLRTHVM